MKIAVCFKITADYSRLSEDDWTWDEHHFVDTGFVRRIFNCYDESALEMALNLSHSAENFLEKDELTALTVDDPKSDLFLKHLMALGYDQGLRIQCSQNSDPGIDLRFNPSAVSHLISTCIRQQGQQLVLFGIQGGDGDNGQTGLLVAEQLGWPCIREVTKVARTKDPGCLKVFSRIDTAALVQTVKLPMVLTIGQSLDAPFLRFPSLKQKLAAKKKQVTLLSDKKLGLNTSKLIHQQMSLVDLERPQAKKSCVFINAVDTREQARHLYDQYLKDRMFP
jgi:electron transfer flavoprotein alpha/beta subunit